MGNVYLPFRGRERMHQWGVSLNPWITIPQFIKSTYLIPTMSSNTVPSGVASESDALFLQYFAYRAMDKLNRSDLHDAWIATGTTNQWIQYEFDTSKTITGYKITAVNGTYGDEDRMPNNFDLVAWNGSGWDTLNSQTGQVFSNAETKEYLFANSVAYTRFRINCLTINGDPAYTEIAEFDLKGY